MDFPLSIPFIATLGFELLRAEGGESEIGVTITEPLTNSWGVAHGGVMMTLLDVAMGQASRSTVLAGLEPSQPGMVTVEMKTTFMRPGQGRLLARGRVLQRTASLAFCEASVFDAEGKLAAHATGTFKFIKRLPVGGRRVHKLGASD